MSFTKAMERTNEEAGSVSHIPRNMQLHSMYVCVGLTGKSNTSILWTFVICALKNKKCQTKLQSFTNAWGRKSLCIVYALLILLERGERKRISATHCDVLVSFCYYRIQWSITTQVCVKGRFKVCFGSLLVDVKYNVFSTDLLWWW